MKPRLTRSVFAIVAAVAVFVLVACEDTRMHGVHIWSAQAGQYSGEAACPSNSQPQGHAFYMNAHNPVGVHVDGADFPGQTFDPPPGASLPYVIGPIQFTSHGCFTVWVQNRGSNFDAGNWIIDCTSAAPNC